MTLENKLFCGDNLQILRGIPDDSVDLCYIDPPFFSNRVYEVIWGDAAETRSFEDRWEGGIEVYISWMRDRVQEIHRVLKSTGSFYLHCDWHADAYLRVMCDQIFGRGPQAVIYWRRTLVVKGTAKGFGMNTDSILYYTKSNSFAWNPIKIAPSDALIKRDYRMVEEETGRRFQAVAFVLPGNNPKTLTFPDGRVITAPEGKRFRWNQATLDERIAANPHCIYWTNTGNPRLKKYVDDHEGNLIDNLWTDITPLQSNSSERLGYPTQKPRDLLERIISASTGVGDVVLDCFCGCGTTIDAARALNRRWIGIDISPTACRLIAARLGVSLRNVVGFPLSAEDIAELSGFEFQNAVCRMINAVPGPRGGDGGVDGVCRGTGAIVQVKKSSIGRPVIDSLVAAMLREGANTGVVVGKTGTNDRFPRSVFEECARLQREQGLTIKVYSFDDLVTGAPFNDGVATRPANLDQYLDDLEIAEPRG